MFTPDDLQNLKFQVEDGIGTITINRPDRFNALNRLVLSELKNLLEYINNTYTHETLRGILLTGEGEKAFIAGADIKEMSRMDTNQAVEFGRLGQSVTFLMEKLPFVVIALVNGHALGGGLEMAMSCDFIFATQNATFGAPEVKLGLIPGFGGTQRLAKILGRNRAKELIYSGRSMGAAEMQEIGLVLRVYESKLAMVNAAKEWLNSTAGNSLYAIGKAKQVMNAGNDLPLAEGLNHELSEFSAIFASQDMREGTRAFLEKRPPKFVGK
ncbi:MAG: enoyl-CoA hydratase [Bdellovibrionales bacterium GWA2_49_15]|nr:MAG: enoyl-CoA hydratase [Bdellovibrionales bacterium GWA2_49_15]HAZ12079.1 enoyl-CoA hydratase [Bdellovibrionales bacterium]